MEVGGRRERLIGQPVRMYVELKDADLFSFCFSLNVRQSHMNRKFVAVLCLLIGVAASANVLAAESDTAPRHNLLVNGAFNFHAFENSRQGEPSAASRAA